MGVTQFGPRGRWRCGMQLALVSALSCSCVSSAEAPPSSAPASATAPLPPRIAEPAAQAAPVNAIQPAIAGAPAVRALPMLAAIGGTTAPTPSATAGSATEQSAAASSLSAAMGGNTALGNAGASGTPAAQADDFREIVAADWELAAGTEKYLCARSTSQETLFMDKLRTRLPPGTHHIGLMASDQPDKPDGVVDCSLLEIGERLITGGGPGSQDLELPDGVAMRYDRGSQILLQLHLFNSTDRPLRGRSITLAHTLAPSAVRFEAEQIPAQLLSLSIPKGASVARGRCTFDHAQTLVSMIAHMHQTGRHAKATLHTAKGDMLLHDADYDFLEQRHYPLPSIPVVPGDYLDYECTFQNDTDRSIGWGESTTDEMCMFGTTRFPRVSNGITCLW